MPVQTPEQKKAAYLAAGLPAPIDAAPVTSAQPVTPSTNDQNPLWLKMGETSEEYSARVAKLSPNYAVAGTSTFDTLSSANLGASQSPQFITPESPDLYTLTPEQQKAQNEVENARKLTTEAAGREQYQAEQNKVFGVGAAESALADWQSQIDTLATEAQQIPYSIQAQFAGRGVTKGGIRPIETAAIRNNLIQTLQVKAQYDAANGKLVSAQNKANRAVDEKFKPIEAQLKAAKDNLELLIASPEYTNAEKKRAQQQLDYQNQVATSIAQQKQNEQNVWKVITDAASYIQNFTPTAQYRTASQAIEAMKGVSPEQALQIAVSTGLTEKQDEKLQFISGTANQAAGYFDKTTGTFTPIGGGGGTDDGGNVSPAGLTPEQQSDPFIQTMLNSAGGKPLTDTFAQKIDKGMVVLTQIGALQASIKGTDTGPIVGAFRDANPWDTNAQTIKAQLNAIVPNLARGVYGEVGVLTDNDIKNYAKTIPNLKSTEDVRNAVLGITVDMIAKSIKNTLAVNAANGKDVSGFVDLYNELLTTRDSVFAQIGTGQPEEQSAGFWSGVTNWLFGTD